MSATVCSHTPHSSHEACLADVHPVWAWRVYHRLVLAFKPRAARCLG